METPLKLVVIPTSPDHLLVFNAYSIEASGISVEGIASAFAETPNKVTIVPAIINFLILYFTPLFCFCFTQSAGPHKT